MRSSVERLGFGDYPGDTEIGARQLPCYIVSGAYSAVRPRSRGGRLQPQLTVSVVIDNDRNQEVANVLAISANPQHPAMYEFAKSGNVYSGTVEAGVYDLVVNINQMMKIHRYCSSRRMWR